MPVFRLPGRLEPQEDMGPSPAQAFKDAVQSRQPLGFKSNTDRAERKFTTLLDSHSGPKVGFPGPVGPFLSGRAANGAGLSAGLQKSGLVA